MTHQERLTWLTAHGFLAESRSVELNTTGTYLWVDGNKGKRPVSIWLSVRTGSAIIHGVSDREMAWEELQAWIVPPVVEVKSLQGQRNLFGDDGDE